MRVRVMLAAAGAATILASAPAGGQPAPMAGYLKADELPSSLTLLPPPPAKGSPAEKRDQDASKAALKLHGGPRWDMATADAVLTFPLAAQTFACAVGVPISEAETPATYRLLRRTLPDLGRSTSPTKVKYKRPRPFMVNNKPMCTPQIEQGLRNDGSYPSGHAAIGWGWGLVLAAAAPERADAILARGRAFADSRRICNVHWLSDTEEGRTMGSAVVARLYANPAFRVDLDAAKAELAAARARGAAPSGNCALEAAQVSPGV